MVALLRPLDLNLVVEERPYKMGEAIPLVVELKARGEVLVREGRVDLVCEECWTQFFTMRVPVHRPMPVRGSGSLAVPTVPKQITEEKRQSYVHSSFVFLAGVRFPSGTARRYAVELQTHPDLLSKAKDVTMKWALVVAVDTALARDVTRRQRVTVTLS